jgi:hypothetical protein
MASLVKCRKDDEANSMCGCADQILLFGASGPIINQPRCLNRDWLELTKQKSWNMQRVSKLSVQNN